jgi:hypothetical protein
LWRQLQFGPSSRVGLFHLDLHLGGEEVDHAWRGRLDHAVQVEFPGECLRGAVAVEYELDVELNAVCAHTAPSWHGVLGVDGEDDKAARLVVVVATVDLLDAAAIIALLEPEVRAVRAARLVEEVVEVARLALATRPVFHARLRFSVRILLLWLIRMNRETLRYNRTQADSYMFVELTSLHFCIPCLREWTSEGTTKPLVIPRMHFDLVVCITVNFLTPHFFAEIPVKQHEKYYQVVDIQKYKQADIRTLIDCFFKF